MRFLSAFLVVLLGGCAAMDGINGMRRFTTVTEGDKVEFQYVSGGPDTALYFNGVKVGTLAADDRDDYVTNQYRSYHSVKSLGNLISDPSWIGWAGVHEDRYLIAECQLTDAMNGERSCFLKQMERCKWLNVGNSRCYITDQELAAAPVLRTMKLGTMPGLSRLTYRADPSGIIEFLFDNKIFFVESFVAFYSKPIGKMLVYSGPLGTYKKAELYCNRGVKYDKSGPVGDYIFCEAYRDVWRDANLIGNVMLYPDKTLAADARAIASRFYVVEKWPLLDSKHKNMVPFAVGDKNEAGNLLQTEWKKWTEN